MSPNLLDIDACLFLKLLLRVLHKIQRRSKGQNGLGFSNNVDEMNVNIQECAIRGRSARVCFKPCLEIETWKYLVVLCTWGESIEEFPSEFTASAEM